MVTSAITGRLWRSVNCCQRRCRRWLLVFSGTGRCGGKVPAGAHHPAGLGDRALGAGLLGGELGGDQAQGGADRVPGEPVPVSDLDRDIEAVTAVGRQQHRLECSVERRPRPCLLEYLPAQPDAVVPGPGVPAGIDDALPQQQFREPMPGALVQQNIKDHNSVKNRESRVGSPRLLGILTGRFHLGPQYRPVRLVLKGPPEKEYS
jgi:hypothetical protein